MISQCHQTTGLLPVSKSHLRLLLTSERGNAKFAVYRTHTGGSPSLPALMETYLPTLRCYSPREQSCLSPSALSPPPLAAERAFVDLRAVSACSCDLPPPDDITCYPAAVHLLAKPLLWHLSSAPSSPSLP